MRLFIYLILTLIPVFHSLAQTNYSVSAIPKNLLSRAGAVVRNSETNIEVKELNDVEYRYTVAITILNASAQNKANIDIFYDKNVQVKSAKGLIYNEFGQPVSKFSLKDFADRSAVSDMSLYEDSRVKLFRTSYSVYPYTIEYEVQIKRRQSLYFPDWLPVDETGLSIEKSSLTFTSPLSYKLRYKEINYPGKVEIEENEKFRTYKWHVTRVNALRSEPFSPDAEQFLTSVKLAPHTFAYRNIEGSFSNWSEYGKWMYEALLKEKQHLSQATKETILALVDTISDPKEKAKKIYEYMQSRSRYISVQIGIGGFQPYPASEVDRLGYGDCKGLVNYTQALLQVAGIESYYCVVQAGQFKKDLLTDFASINQGNHVILCLPFKNDTTWLECTDKFSPFGFLGDFTDGRQVIACTPAGGKLMRTTDLKHTDNRQIRRAEFKISQAGHLEGFVNTTFHGTQFDNHDILFNEAYAEQLKKLPELYPYPNMEILSFEYRKDKTSKPVTIENLNFKSHNYCVFNEGKLHLTLNNLNRFKNVPRELSNRINPVFINRGWYDEDIISYEIPEGYKLNFGAKNTKIEKPFGSFSMDIILSNNKVTYKRVMQVTEGIYKPEDYQELVSFLQSVYEADTLQLILSK